MMGQTRAEHMAACKKRALAYLPGDPREAITSMLSDLSKHDETGNLCEGILGELAMQIMMKGGGAEEARRWIEGFAE